MLNDGLLMLVIINPFAQMLYLSQLMNQVSAREFAAIFLQGTILTLTICLTCAFLGEFILFKMFQVSLPAMRIFGGLVNLTLSYSYVMKGPEGIKLFRGDVTQLAQQIALPVMVGAGVVWVSMKIGQSHTPPITIVIIATVLAINGLMVLGYQGVFKNVQGRLEMLLVKYFGVAMRFNALLIGAVSIEMILGGIRDYMNLPVTPL